MMASLRSMIRAYNQQEVHGRVAHRVERVSMAEDEPDRHRRAWPARARRRANARPARMHSVHYRHRHRPYATRPLLTALRQRVACLLHTMCVAMVAVMVQHRTNQAKLVEACLLPNNTADSLRYLNIMHIYTLHFSR